MLSVIDALGKMVPWSSLTLNNTTSATVTTPPMATGPAASGSSLAPLSSGGFDIVAYLLYGTTVVNQTTSLGSLTQNSASLISLAGNTNALNVIGSPNRQFPGIGWALGICIPVPVPRFIPIWGLIRISK